MTNTEKNGPKGYTISWSQGSKYIQCHTCGRASFNPNDIENLYCGHCHVFHEPQEEAVPTNETP